MERHLSITFLEQNEVDFGKLSLPFQYIYQMLITGDSEQF